MANYSTDKDGLLHFRNDQNQVQFDRVNAVNSGNWSSHPAISGRFTVVSTTTGKTTNKV